MSIYLYNLAFSLNSSDTPAGRFQPYNSNVQNPTIANQSCAWFTAASSNPPQGFGDWFQQVSIALISSQWGNPQSDASSLSLEPGDYLVMRVFSADPNVASYRVRVTGVFGQGTSEAAADTDETLQSPLVMSTQTTPSTYPRAVIDVDGSAATNWPTPITADGSWVSWLGAVHTPSDLGANEYTLNVGVSVLSGNSIYTFGTDPKMKVGPGMIRHKHHHHAA
ncbi:MAG TPA: hypothetical protein VMB18_12740 [Terriglobales bacterium]|nr:hypothetical protein [Terriglobales bacterium]